ncbi:VOC family protein [Halostella salina]|uniref:VOC family protein n=1 Tax=Halostella salina TaxID=1547897 RepID=UPI000EF818B1|nr:VOC family protein [Halostella salina]
MDAALDHVMFACEDLDAMRDTFDRIGLPATYGGVHDEVPTEMAMLGFDNGTYLELIAPVESDHPPDDWPDAMFTAGPCRWCLRTDEIHRELDGLEAAGATVHGPTDAARERPDGTVVEYEEAVYGADESFWQFPFLVSDITPRDQRIVQSDWAAESPLSGITEVVIAVADLDDAIDQFRRLHGYQAPKRSEHVPLDATIASFPETPVTLAEPLSDDTRLSARLENFEEGPCAVLLGARDFTAATATFPTTPAEEWNNSRIAWFDVPELEQRVGILEQ